MKKFFSFAMLAVAAMAAFSCKQEINVDEATASVKAPKVVTAYTDADVTPSSKTSLDGVTILWSASDEVKAYSFDGDVVSSTSTAISEGGKKAEFTFAGLDASADIYMYAYPAAAVTDMDGDNDVVYASIPSEQKAVAGSFADGANLAVAMGDTNPIFRNVGGLVSFKIKNDGIVSISLTANEVLAGGSAEVLVDDDPIADVTGGSKEVILYADATAPLANGSTYYAVVYPGTYTGLKLVFTDTAGRTATYSNPNTLTVNRNANLSIWDMAIADGKWVSIEKGDMWSYTFEKTIFDAIGTKTLNTREWTVAGDGNFFGYDSTKGQQFGSGAAPFKSLTLSSDFGSDYGVADVTVNTSGANSINATVSVSVGGVAYVIDGSTDTSASLTNAAEDYKFVSPDGNLHVGNVEIVYTQTSSKALYVKSITVNEDNREQVATPTFSPAAGPVDENATVTISTTTSGATIYYTVDGTDPTEASTQSNTVVIDKAMTVKAIAVKDGMRKSEIAEAKYTLKGGYPSVETSNVTLSIAGGTSVYSAKVNDKDALKAGTGSIAGAVVITVPANTTTLHLHAAGWNGESVVLGITGATATPSSLTLTACSTVSGSGSSYLVDSVEDYYFKVDLTGITSETALTFNATSGKRFVIWGVNVEPEPDELADAGMSWSASTATATINNDGIVFTAPTLTMGHATGITYESTEPTVATISTEGVVSVLAAGETTIKAIFAGDANYKAATVSYVLTVTDNRTSGVVNTSTEDNPYSAAEAVELAEQLSGEKLENVYVKGIISSIYQAYNSSFNNVSFKISADGTTSGAEFLIYRIAANSATDYEVGDAVLIKGTLVYYNNNTPEFEAGSTCITKVKKPVLSPDGGVFTETQSVTITAESGATIYYTINGDTPTTSSSVYSAALSLTETTTVKAIAVKGALVTGVVSATFTKNDPNVESVVYTLDGTITGGNNGYSDESTISQADVNWKVVGNTTINPWRIGGKSLTDVDRTIYSTDSIKQNISKIVITHGSASGITVNSMTVIVATDAEFTSEVSSLSATFASNADVTIERPSGKDWSNCYYKIVYNVTVSDTSNKYFQFIKAAFTGK